MTDSFVNENVVIGDIGDNKTAMHQDSQEIRDINPIQKQIMLEFFKAHPYLVLKKDTNTFFKKESVSLWSQLAQKLNAVPGSDTKGWEQWESIWRELYSRLKSQDVDNITNIDQLILDVVNKASDLPFNEVLASNANENCDPSTISDEDVKLKCECKTQGMEMYEKENIKESVEQGRHKEQLSSNSEHVNLVQNAGIISKQFIENKLPEEASAINSPINLSKAMNLDKESSVTQNTGLSDLSVPTSSTLALHEKTLIKKLIKSDLIRIRYLKQKLKMEGEYHKRKLALMKDLLMVKQRKVRVEEKQATALIRIARSLDRMMQQPQLHQR